MAAFVAALTLSVWLVTGAHTGWTRTTVTIMKIDPITEIEYPETRKEFVAGVDVVAAGMALSFLLLGASLLFKQQPTNH